MAVTASQDRHETPRTHLGLPSPPEHRPLGDVLNELEAKIAKETDDES
jgi:hypothetical protein